MSSAPKPRPKYYDLNLAHLPPPGLVSIFHRISGAVLFLAIPVFLAILQATLASETDYHRWRDFFSQPLVKLVAIGFVWLYAHHFFAGIRYLLLDLHIGIEKIPANATAKLVFALGAIATLLIGWWLW